MNHQEQLESARERDDRVFHGDEVTFSKGGLKERRVKLASIQVPDLWHVASDSPYREMILETWHLAHDLLRALHEAAALLAQAKG